MSHFTSESKLPSCAVTKELIESIENYLKSRLLAIANNEEDKNFIVNALTISITDAFGTERLKSIAEFSLPKFSDSTTRVEVLIRPSYRSTLDRFDIDVQFDTERFFSRVKMSYDGPNSRELVTGLIQGVLNCVATTKNKNWIYNLSYGPNSALWGLAIFSPSIIMATFKASSLWTYLLVLLFLCLYAYLFGAKKLRPYTTFDSNASEKRDWLWSWFIGGFLTFIIFSSLLTKFRDFIISRM